MFRRKYLSKNHLTKLNIIVQTNQPSINIHNSRIKNSRLMLFQGNHVNDGAFSDDKEMEFSKTILDPNIFIDKESRAAFQEQIDYFYRTIRNADASQYKDWEENLGQIISRLNNPENSYEDRLNAVNEFQGKLKPLSTTGAVLKKIGICLAITAAIAIACTAIAAFMLIAATSMNLIGIAGVAMFALTGVMNVTAELTKNSNFFKKEDRRKLSYGIFRDNEIKGKSQQDKFFMAAKAATYSS